MKEQDDYSVDIQTEAFEQDFDAIAWEPVVVDDSDEEAKELFGY